MIEVSKESEMVPMGTSRKSGDLTWNDPKVNCNWQHNFFVLQFPSRYHCMYYAYFKFL